ncbi:hypothetical protein HK097_003420 [Rhizophlyctis rosea]|uniref:SAP domain-containing protein n=1 Tax=Rhizophlyctis rosea TaxID=64517 RepID=A0AAD5SGH4_9FUNG|nr:hypothetical protein HK097_003420 [Rhizophlyctis rosea]
MPVPMPGPYPLRRAVPQPTGWDHPPFFDYRPPVDPATEQGYRMMTQSLGSAVPELVGPPARWKEEIVESSNWLQSFHPSPPPSALHPRANGDSATSITTRMKAIKQRFMHPYVGGDDEALGDTFGVGMTRRQSADAVNGLPRRTSMTRYISLIRQVCFTFMIDAHFDILPSNGSSNYALHPPGVRPMAAATYQEEPGYGKDRLDIEELRAHLARRGLPTDGDEAELIDRLESAIDGSSTGVIDLTSDDEDRKEGPVEVLSRTPSPSSLPESTKKRAAPTKDDGSDRPMKRPTLGNGVSTGSLNGSMPDATTLGRPSSADLAWRHNGWTNPAAPQVRTGLPYPRGQWHAPFMTLLDFTSQTFPSGNKIVINPKFLNREGNFLGGVLPSPPISSASIPALLIPSTTPPAVPSALKPVKSSAASAKQSSNTPASTSTGTPVQAKATTPEPLTYSGPRIVEENGKKERIIFADAHVTPVSVTN